VNSLESNLPGQDPEVGRQSPAPKEQDHPETPDTQAADPQPVSAGPEATPAAEIGAAVDGADSETSPANQPAYEVGQRVWGQVLRMTDSQAVVALGERGLEEGNLDLIHLRDKFGNLSLNEGDEVQAYVTAVSPAITLAPSMLPPTAEVYAKLKASKEADEVVMARVVGLNRGGMELDLEGQRGFCPYSHIEIGRCENPEIYLNHILDFKITELDEDKKRVVLSRRVILEAERQEKLHELVAQIKEGAEFEGVVTRLQPFGSFVDIGGVEGLVHVSEMSFDRIGHPQEVVRRGEKVRVKVLGITRGKDGKDRIRLSMKALMQDPWLIVDEVFKHNDIVTGMVTRLTDFGAFIKLHPGVEGLLHISEYKPRDVGANETPSEPATAAADKTADEATRPADGLPVAGREITVRIARIDRDRRRISLSLQNEDREEGKKQHDASVGEVHTGVVRTIKPYGVFVDLPTVGPWVSGLLPAAETGLERGVNLAKKFTTGQEVKVEIIEIDDRGRLRLSQRSLLDPSEGGLGAAGSRDAMPTAPPGGFNVFAEAMKRAQQRQRGDA
jgi:small subunit ribosomal protein S1